MRTNDAEIGAHLREILRAHVVPDLEPPPNLSLFVGDNEGSVRELHRLYRGALVVVHTRSTSRLVRAALAHLDGFASLPPGVIRFNTRVLVRDGGAVLVDAALGGHLDRIERRLERLDYQVADVHGAAVDRETSELVLWPPRLELDAGALAALEREHPRERRELALTSTRLPITAVVVPAYEHDDDEPASPAQRLVELAHLAIDDHGLLHGSDLEFIRDLVQKGLVTHATGFEDRELIERLESLG